MESHGTLAERPIFVSPQVTSDLLGLPRTAVFRLLRERRLDSVRVGKRRLVSRASVERFADELLATDS